jgi:hypothetical protein
MSKPINPHPEKALPHVVTALIQKRGELVGRIDHIQSELKQAVIDLDNVEATLRIFAPEADIPDLAPRNVPPADPAERGDHMRVILTALREAARPLTTNELTEAVMKVRGLEIANAKLFRTMSKRVGACLRNARSGRGTIKSMPGPAQQHLWMINPANAT